MRPRTLRDATRGQFGQPLDDEWNTLFDIGGEQHTVLSFCQSVVNPVFCLDSVFSDEIPNLGISAGRSLLWEL